MKEKSSPLDETSSTRHAQASFDASISTSPEPYVHAQISISEYRILNPQTAEIPTLTQSRLLAAVLERQQVKAEKLAQRQERQRRLLSAAKRAALHPWQTLAALLHLPHPHRPSTTLSLAGRA